MMRGKLWPLPALALLGCLVYTGIEHWDRVGYWLGWVFIGLFTVFLAFASIMEDPNDR